MGNTIIAREKIDDDEFNRLHEVIINISKRLLLKYEKYLNKSICGKIKKDSIKELNKLKLKYIINLF